MQALGAEIVVVFEGTSEFGHQFSTRQSYLPRELHWGYQFVQIVHPADPGSTQHIVDISRWGGSVVLLAHFWQKRPSWRQRTSPATVVVRSTCEDWNVQQHQRL